MAKRRPLRRHIRALCAKVDSEDGIDPKHQSRAFGGSKRPPRKTLQLCGQVMQALDQALAGLCDDDVLRCLYVTQVIPAPNETRLLVSVTNHPALGAVDPIDALARLDQVTGLLRTEVAAEITRKRAPSLVFRFVVSTEMV